ncbi:hypothetical protein ACPESN_08995 [Stutzerimonas marianensis]
MRGLSLNAVVTQVEPQQNHLLAETFLPSSLLPSKMAVDGKHRQ